MMRSGETTPLRHPEFYQFDLNIAGDCGSVASWQRDQSWLLEPHRTALRGDADLKGMRAACPSGEGR